jgi:biotin carboxyl carrier protein
LSFEARDIPKERSHLDKSPGTSAGIPIAGDLRLSWTDGVLCASLSTATSHYEFIPALNFTNCIERGEHTWLHSTSVSPHGVSHSFQVLAPLNLLKHHRDEAGSGQSQIKSHLPGKIVSVHTSSGASVAAGELLVVLESMKMEHRIEAPLSGTVQMLSVSAGESVEAGRLLLTLEANA